MKNRYGSIYFLSPEIIEQNHDFDWLVWNVGAIVYMLLTGRQVLEEYGFQRYQTALKNNVNSFTNFCVPELKGIGKPVV